MKNTTFSLLALLLLVLGSSYSSAQRMEIPFNDNWTFQGQSISGAPIAEVVTLPHSWNKTDAQQGIPYYRGDGHYTKKFQAKADWRNKRVFIRFEGANIQTSILFNNQELGTHKGGYAAFCYELTDLLNYDKENIFEVTVNNEANLEIPPLVGDFNNYGGIYRPVRLIVTDPVCITPLDYASPGVYLKQERVSKDQAQVEVLTKLSNGSASDIRLTYRTTILDASGTVLQSKNDEHILPAGNNQLSHSYTILSPRLWQGKKDPYLYQVKVELVLNGKVIDTMDQPLGLRFFHIDPNEGFFLNGEPIDLRGVSRHQDRQDKASALSDADHQEDMKLMLEMGVNALRLAHYQHAEKIYDMADSAGVIVWAELPWVGAPGNAMGSSNGYENTDAFHSNTQQQLLELIRQNFNHPSILLWSIFNEIQNPKGAEPTDFINELNRIVKTEDPSRISVGASMLNPLKHPNIHNITDAIAWNRYYGWYYGESADMGKFLDEVHANFPEFKIGISEYGAGGSIHQHTDKLTRPNPMGSPHPEEWQSSYHEENLKIFDDRPYIWGTFVWNMFDFGSFFRKEGDHYGINDKGLVTYDRKTKKDAFFFYKANWSEEPVLHITSSRYIFRPQKQTQVKIYTNLPEVSLKVNGKEWQAKSPEKGIAIWENIPLKVGTNAILVQGFRDGQTYTDDCVWVVENPFGGMNLFIKIFDFLMVAYRYVIGGLVAAFLVWFFGIRKHQQSARWKRILLWALFILLVVLSLFVLFFKLYLPTIFGT